ncbi:MAG: M3 family oligoendopeptidase [Chloroflexi bacterium]|uniref:M3 family oligoendopeptidase n=1 Tax=Candidatus Chlorohelix allophototropha TaxID=3003348 RepID=A0A8T7M6M2_9CHLR|nr:M3 family oligoendopeptidase [Chloroflexota bacterium]WJW69682.1 M3 family oligoendopeptidase [Chloroflexota bacterium L227-S17]
MLASLPSTSEEIKNWKWDDIAPFYEELEKRELNAGNREKWLADWTSLSDVVMGYFARLKVDVSCNTADTGLESELNDWLQNNLPPLRSAENRLIRKLLESGLIPRGMEIPLKKMRVANEIFREENLALMAEEAKLSNEYAKISGAQAVKWNGEELTLSRLRLVQMERDRESREKAWKADLQRQLQDREAFNQLWVRMLGLRQQIAANAGLGSYTEYKWKQLNRFDYTPEDCHTFHKAILETVVPAATRVYERRKKQLEVEALRPWDLEVETRDLPPLKPFENGEQLQKRAEVVFKKVDGDLGEYFATMRREQLLDLENRKAKAPGGYCIGLFVQGKRRPFIFMNAVGTQRDVTTMLHEAGHAFHAFETAKLPYHQQRGVGSEFNEVASMAMELLGAPYLHEAGFYTQEEATRARVAHLEKILLFWPYMAVVDAFQLWAYANPDEAANPANCDHKWGELWDRFMPGEDWSGLEEEKVTGWHRKLHIFQHPFYYVEYGMAQLGAVQVWANSLKNANEAVQAYRNAHRLGGTVSLPELYATAGAHFAFDIPALQNAVDLIERTITELSK